MFYPKSKKEVEVPDRLPVLPLRNMVLFPGIPSQLLVGRQGSLRLVDDALERERLVAVVTQKAVDEDQPGPDGVNEYGVVALVQRAYRLPDNQLQVLVNGLQRIRLGEYL